MRIAPSRILPVSRSAVPRPQAQTDLVIGDPIDSSSIDVEIRIQRLEARADRCKNFGDGLGVFMFSGFPSWAAPCFILGGTSGMALGAVIGGSLIAGSLYAESKSREYRDRAMELRPK